MRQIVLDTETTGLDPRSGHRIIEVACIEMENRRFTGRHLHKYVNPEREIDEGAQAGARYQPRIPGRQAEIRRHRR